MRQGKCHSVSVGRRLRLSKRQPAGERKQLPNRYSVGMRHQLPKRHPAGIRRTCSNVQVPTLGGFLLLILSKVSYFEDLVGKTLSNFAHMGF